MHLVTQVSNGLWFGCGGDFLQQRLSEVPLSVWVIKQERVWLEVVHGLVSLVDGADFQDAAVSQLAEVHISIGKLFLGLLQAAF